MPTYKVFPSRPAATGILVLSPLATVWRAEEEGTECGINSAPLTLFKPNLFASL